MPVRLEQNVLVDTCQARAQRLLERCPDTLSAPLLIGSAITALPDHTSADSTTHRPCNARVRSGRPFATSALRSQGKLATCHRCNAEISRSVSGNYRNDKRMLAYYHNSIATGSWMIGCTPIWHPTRFALPFVTTRKFTNAPPSGLGTMPFSTAQPFVPSLYSDL